MIRELRKDILKSAKRVVIKIGSGVISDHESGKNPLERGLCRNASAVTPNASRPSPTPGTR